MAYLDKISPTGYHVLTLSEIGLIQTALGVDAGGKMKTEGFEHWDDPNTGATNETGFSAVGCGKRDWNTGLFSGQRKQAMLWLADEYDTSNAGAYTLANGNALLGVAEQWNKGEGLSVRLAMDNPALFTPGMTVNDADGNTYNLVKIHLADEVPFTVKYGLLYNWYAATDVRKITSSDDWIIPTQTQMLPLRNFCDPINNSWYSNNAAHPLKDILTMGGSDLYGFKMKRTGVREGGGVFSNNNNILWLSNDSTINGYYLNFLYGNANKKLLSWYYVKIGGHGLRPVKLTSSLTHGQTGFYTGNDGKIYETICIDCGGGNKYEVLTDNLCETKYRNGDTIPEVTDNAAWAALTTGALCAYNNDWGNAYIGSPAVDIVVTVENLRTTKYANGDPIVHAQPNNEWINAVGGAYCTFEPAPPQHVIEATSATFKMATKIYDGLAPKFGTTFTKSLHMTAQTGSLALDPKTITARIGKGFQAEQASFVTSLKTTNFVKSLNQTSAAGAYSVSPKTAEFTVGTTSPTIYIDPTNAASGRNGTIENPYNSFSEVTFQSNYAYKLKLGVEFISSTRIYCNGLSNVSFSTYGTGATPKFIYSGGGDSSACILLNNCTNVSFDNWDVSGNNNVWAIFRNDNSNRTTINNCYLHNALYQGERGGFGIRGSGSKLRVLNTIITHTSNDGVYLANVPYLEIGNSYVAYVNLYEPMVSGNNPYGGDGIQINGRYNNFHIHHTVIDRNVDTIGNKYCMLIDQAISDPVQDGGIIEYCTFRSNSAVLGGLILGHNLNTIVRYNTFEASGVIDGALKLTGGSVQNTMIYGNKFYGITGRGINLGYSYTGSGGWGASVNTKIYHNTFFNMAAGGGNWGCVWSDQTNAECKNNIFHMNGNTSVAFKGIGGSTWVLSNNCFDALSSVGDSAGLNAVIGDPLFVDKGDYDFHLQEESPCIEAGELVGIDFDFDGVEIPQGTAPCIGAFEFV